MLKRVLTVAIAAMLISIPAVATGATKKKHVKTNHNATITVSVVNVSPPGALAQGRQVYAGIADGTIGGKAVHGAVRGVNNISGAHLTGTVTAFASTGTVTNTISADGKPNADGSLGITGTDQVQGGTATYTGASGSLTISGKVPAKDADGDNDALVGTFTLTGKIKY